MIFKHSLFSLIRDFKNFKGITANRQQKFDSAPATPVPKPQGVNEQQKRLHPQTVPSVLTGKKTLANGGMLIDLKSLTGAFPVFRAGQCVNAKIKDNLYPLWIADTVGNALNATLSLYVPADSRVFAFISELLLNKEILIGSPVGYFYYQPLRDGNRVLFVCDESGLGAAISFAKEKNAPEKEVLCVCQKEFDEPLGVSLCQFDELTGTRTDTLFVCGKKAFCEAVIGKINPKSCRRLYTDEPIITEEEPKSYRLLVTVGLQEYPLTCYSHEPLIEALERSNIMTWNKCPTGDCSFCKARLISGKIRVISPQGQNSVRKADEKYGFIHPCISYPQSDIILKY